MSSKSSPFLPEWSEDLGPDALEWMRSFVQHRLRDLEDQRSRLDSDISSLKEMFGALLNNESTRKDSPIPLKSKSYPVLPPKPSLRETSKPLLPAKPPKPKRIKTREDKEPNEMPSKQQRNRNSSLQHPSLLRPTLGRRRKDPKNGKTDIKEITKDMKEIRISIDKSSAVKEEDELVISEKNLSNPQRKESTRARGESRGVKVLSGPIVDDIKEPEPTEDEFRKTARDRFRQIEQNTESKRHFPVISRQKLSEKAEIDTEEDKPNEINTRKERSSLEALRSSNKVSQLRMMTKPIQMMGKGTEDSQSPLFKQDSSSSGTSDDTPREKNWKPAPPSKKLHQLSKSPPTRLKAPERGFKLPNFDASKVNE